MNTAILILAASNFQTSWDLEGCRHLIDVNGEPLLMRTMRQLMDMGYDMTIVTDKSEIHAVIPDCFIPEDYRWLVSTMLSTRELWDDRTVVLFGDVVWDAYALDLILSIEEYPRFYGYGNEIFAITWLREHFGKIEAALKATRAWVNANQSRRCYPNHFYAAFHGKENLH